MDKQTKLTNAFEAFTDRCIQKGLSRESLRGYRNWCAPFLREFGERPVGELTTDDMKGYTSEVVMRVLHGEIAQNTAASYVRNMKILMNFVSDELDGDVAFSTRKISALKTPKKDAAMYNKEQLDKLFMAAEQSRLWLTERNRAIIALALDSGMRRAELAGVTISDYLAARGSGAIKVTGKGKKDRYVPIGRHTQDMINAYLAECPFPVLNALFVGHRGAPLTPNGLGRIMEEIAHKVGFTFSLHRLRHHFATEYLLYSYESANNMDAYGLRTLLGHSSFSTTDRYIHSATSISVAKKHKPIMDRISPDKER